MELQPHHRRVHSYFAASRSAQLGLDFGVVADTEDRAWHVVVWNPGNRFSIISTHHRHPDNDDPAKLPTREQCWERSDYLPNLIKKVRTAMRRQREEQRDERRAENEAVKRQAAYLRKKDMPHTAHLMETGRCPTFRED